jgi:3-hydroxymyristoyl/3-hydroxydecanoyl-(acyl carrier protein) dehydratase
MLRIPASHASLAGHFPGRPIVPGVLLLDCVLAAAEQWLGRPLNVHSLPLAKFIAPLLPEQSAKLELTLAGSELRFSIALNERADETLASGRFVLHGEPGA